MTRMDPRYGVVLRSRGVPDLVVMLVADGGSARTWKMLPLAAPSTWENPHDIIRLITTSRWSDVAIDTQWEVLDA